MNELHNFFQLLFYVLNKSIKGYEASVWTRIERTNRLMRTAGGVLKRRRIERTIQKKGERTHYKSKTNTINSLTSVQWKKHREKNVECSVPKSFTNKLIILEMKLNKSERIKWKGDIFTSLLLFTLIMVLRFFSFLHLFILFTEKIGLLNPPFAVTAGG